MFIKAAGKTSWVPVCSLKLAVWEGGETITAVPTRERRAESSCYSSHPLASPPEHTSTHATKPASREAALRWRPHRTRRCNRGLLEVSAQAEKQSRYQANQERREFKNTNAKEIKLCFPQNALFKWGLRCVWQCCSLGLCCGWQHNNYVQRKKNKFDKGTWHLMAPRVSLLLESAKDMQVHAQSIISCELPTLLFGVYWIAHVIIKYDSMMTKLLLTKL